MGYALNGDIIQAEADAVIGIFTAVSRGSAFRDIARALSGQPAPTGHTLPDIPTMPRHTHTLAIERNARREASGEPVKPVPPAGPWSTTALLGIARKPRYAGYSVYRDRTATKDKKRTGWRDSILRDDHGEPILGQWDPIVPDDLWWRVQEVLDQPD